MIDNFTLISETILDFKTDDDFYVVEIIKRKKDNPDMNKSEKLIDVYEINNIKELEEHKPYIIEKCNHHNARAYIRVNKRSHKRIALETLREVANRVANNNYNIHNVYHSMLGKFHSSDNKKWIIDLDGDNDTTIVLIYQILQFRLELYKRIPMVGLNNVITQIPTKNGLHLIVSPFPLDLFKKEFPNIDIHKDNGTILYIP